MELENLKTAWSSVDEQLEEREILSSEMVVEMLKKKSNKSLRRLRVWDLVGIVIGLPLVIYIWFPLLRDLRFDNTYLILTGVLVIIIAIMFIISLAMNVYATKYLLKMDFSESIKDNVQYINKSEILYRKSNVTLCFLPIPLTLLFVMMVFKNPADIGIYIVLFVAIAVLSFVVVAPIYFIERNFRKKHIKTIKESLAELSELEEN